MAMRLSEAAQLLDAGYSGEDVNFCGVSTDTRSLQQGNLFVALKGPNFDGHEYLQQAREKGAVAATVEHPVEPGIPVIEVPDTCLALGALASGWRSRFELPLIAVTGSNGKTTVKEMIAAILSQSGETLVTRGNLNNDIGVPQTLFRLSDEHRYAVIELGANHPGEIAYLTKLTRPTVGLVNNAAAAHLEGFGNLQGVARAKGELFAGLAANAACIINADDENAALWKTLAGQREIITFGLGSGASVSARWQGDVDGSDVEMKTPAGALALRLPLPGRHNVLNALAASAASLAVGVSLDDIATGLSCIKPVQGRWQVLRGSRGSHLVNDTYNANPGSLRAALELLSQAGGERWLVLGDMGELGADSVSLHRDMGELARDLGVQRLFTLGTLAQAASAGFGAGAQHFEQIEPLQSLLAAELRQGTTLLVKGSRSMRLERVIDALVVAGNSGEGI